MTTKPTGDMVKYLRKSIQHIQAVSCGEIQVSDDDTGVMGYIFCECERTLHRLSQHTIAASENVVIE